MNGRERFTAARRRARGRLHPGFQQLHPPPVRPAHYRTMVEAVRRWGTYPLDCRMVRRYRHKSYIIEFARRQKGNPP